MGFPDGNGAEMVFGFVLSFPWLTFGNHAVPMHFLCSARLQEFKILQEIQQIPDFARNSRFDKKFNKFQILQEFKILQEIPDLARNS